MVGPHTAAPRHLDTSSSHTNFCSLKSWPQGLFTENTYIIMACFHGILDYFKLVTTVILKLLLQLLLFSVLGQHLFLSK